MITIQELLYNRGLDRSASTKLVRHKDRRLDLYNLYRTDRAAFLRYQCHQERDVFSKVDYIVSFVGEDGVQARFVGVWKVEGKSLADDGCYIYTMSEVAGYEDLKERVIIRWENAISWHQWIKNEMEVLEISPGLHYKRFTDYSDLILDFNELCEIVECNYKDWRNVLSAIRGVYLITDLHTGKLYVGSAYGEDGIWGRWSEYVATGGHGGNKSLRELIAQDEYYASKFFQFSILMLLPKTVTSEEAISKEQLFKRKLGSNSFGLNNN
ncbi:MAG: GIY-YIG nuclease family protein [Prevotella sp.]|nr:GIY-YIG nuclease family protein [Prevotella sp.]